MANPEQVLILKQGVKKWNEWRIEHEVAQIDLNGADLSALDLREVNLSDTGLDNVDFRETDLTKADLSFANLASARFTTAMLSGVNLRDSMLWEATFRDADLIAADLRNADLIMTIFQFGDLNGADFSYATLAAVTFSDVDLASVKGLEVVSHRAPSTVGIDTILKSKGQIPEAFLRGAGVPDALIAYTKSLVGSGIEFYSCFISHSTRDQEFADRLHADLQAKGVRCWFAPHDVKGGRKLHEQIDEAIRLHDRLLLILSPHSMTSEWVKTEMSKARKRELRDKTRVLFPISLVPFEAIRDWECFDADTGKDSAREIREYFIPDFSNWKDNDSYQKAFERLLKDLSAGARSNRQ